MDNIYISKKLIDEADVWEIDIDFKEAFGFDYDYYNDIIDINKNKSSLDSEPILIDRLINILKELKNNGANYVQLEENCDNQGYDIEGFQIRLATPEEIENYHNKDKILEEEEKKEKIKKLEEELKKLKD
jgi:hypothetical protein